MKRLLNYISILMLIVVTSCFKDPYHNTPASNLDEKSVVLQLAVPSAGAQPAATRSMGAFQENTIETLDVLAFKVEGAIETFQYWAGAKKGAGNDEGSASQSFTATLRVQDYQQRFVLIANAHQKVMDLIAQVDWRHAEKEAMLAQLTFALSEQAGGGDRWNATGASNYTAIPMWGESAPRIITAATTAISDAPVPMLRMVAKIEVQLDQSVSNLTNTFKLKSVHVYNTNKSGRIVPKSGTEYIENMTAKKASLPAAVSSVVGPLAYTDFTQPAGTPDRAMKGAIYLFETAAKNAGNFLEETTIVVGGYYDTDNYETYYRLDFFDTDGATHLDILRNHNYTCNIIEVKGRGLPTVDDAYRTKSFNMTANILVWNEGLTSNVMLDGLYMLGLSHDRFELNAEAHTITSADNILKIITNHPAGWTATVWGDKAGTTPAPWLSLSAAAGAGDAQYHDVHLLMGKNPGLERTAYIFVKAGRMTNVITLTQKIVNIATIPDGGTPLGSIPIYAGAFWRHDQTGERIIRISNITGANNIGEWSASVAWMDGNWNDGDIVLDANMLDATSLANRGIDFGAVIPNNQISDAEGYKLSGTAQSVSGTVANGGSIMFRIGLKSNFTAYDEFTNPARYAVVVFAYNLNATPKYLKLFLRQGEGTDNISTTTSPTDHSAVKWSPYNVGNYDVPSQYGNGGFVDFPTKAGYMYQWGYSTTVSTPHPYPPQGAIDGSQWGNQNSALYTLSDVCPDGYILPSGNRNGTSEQSSLVYDDITNSSISNVFGYYADGYFDRRMIVPSSTVSEGNDDVAYRGTLIFNSITNASIFFPAAGRRTSSSSFYAVSLFGYYWSRREYNASQGYCFLPGNGTLPQVSNALNSYAQSVRCVRDY